MWKCCCREGNNNKNNNKKKKKSLFFCGSGPTHTKDSGGTVGSSSSSSFRRNYMWEATRCAHWIAIGPIEAQRESLSVTCLSCCCCCYNNHLKVSPLRTFPFSFSITFRPFDSRFLIVPFISSSSNSKSLTAICLSFLLWKRQCKKSCAFKKVKVNIGWHCLAFFFV